MKGRISNSRIYRVISSVISGGYKTVYGNGVLPADNEVLGVE